MFGIKNVLMPVIVGLAVRDVGGDANHTNAIVMHRRTSTASKEVLDGFNAITAGAVSEPNIGMKKSH